MHLPLGVLELGVIEANNLLPMHNDPDGRGSTDAFCVAEYRQKSMRTRTITKSFNPKWNQHYTWAVYDPCTVLIVGVFYDRHVRNGVADEAEGLRDTPIGKIRVRLSTLEIDRIYTSAHPLRIVTASGIKKMGELKCSVRFSCASTVNVIQTYLQPSFPRMHYYHPIEINDVESLRIAAMNLVASRICRTEPPLSQEVVQFMREDSRPYSMRLIKTAYFRLINSVSGLFAAYKWFNDIRLWKNPVTTQFRSRSIDLQLSLDEVEEELSVDELEEELKFVTGNSPECMILKQRYERLRDFAIMLQVFLDDVACSGERLQSLLSWRDPRATFIFTIFSLVAAIVLYATPFRVVAVLVGLYVLRHPKLRDPVPSAPLSFFTRLPTLRDRIVLGELEHLHWTPHLGP